MRNGRAIDASRTARLLSSCATLAGRNASDATSEAVGGAVTARADAKEAGRESFALCGV